MSEATVDSAPALSIALQPVIACGARQPFAWHSVVTLRSGRSFAAAAAALPPQDRPALEAARITLAIEAGVRAGLDRGEALLAIPIGAAGSMAEALLSHLFRTALAWRFPVDRLVVAINADERGDLACATALAQACTARGIAVALDDFAAGPLALKLLARFTPAYLALAPSLVRNIAASPSRRLMAEGVMRLARGMAVPVAARGEAAPEDHAALGAIGARRAPCEAAVLPPAPPARREPRSTLPQHRRLTAHQRLSAGRPAGGAAGLSAAM